VKVELPPGESMTTAACPDGKTLIGGGGGVTISYVFLPQQDQRLFTMDQIKTAKSSGASYGLTEGK